MQTTGKAHVLILSILTGVFAFSTVVGFVLEEQERRQRIHLETQVSQLARAREAADEKLAAIQKDIARVEADLIAAQEENRRMANQLTESRATSRRLDATLSDRDDAIAQLTEELRMANQERAEMMQRLGRVETSAHKLQGRLARLQKEKTDLETQLDGTDHAVDLEPVRITSSRRSVPPTAGSMISQPMTPRRSLPGPMNGRVLVVNREYDFVVLNMGKANGVRLGDEFHVVRGSMTLGRVKVEKLYEALAAAAILPETDKASLQEGDTVRSVVSGR